jgi:cell division protease FtsH
MSRKARVLHETPQFRHDGAGSYGIAAMAIAAMHMSEGLGDQLVYRGGESEALPEIRRDPKLRATVEKHLQELQRRAEAIVHRHRDAIAAVATELAAKRFLSGGAVGAIVAQFQAGPRPPGIITRRTGH